MIGDKKAIDYLNKILANELIAINQYFLHAKMHHNWGFSKLASQVKAESIDEMKHADTLADRILQLDGLPNFQQLGKLSIGQTVPESFECDAKLEEVAIADLKEAIAYLESIKDFNSADILHTILQQEEEHLDWIETQLSLIKQVGLDNYLQLQI